MTKIPIKNKSELDLMRESCKLTSKILDEVTGFIKPGISTEDINSFVHNLTVKSGATPSPLNYKGFPKSVCTSLNDVICHGIPSPYIILKEGDIINVDVTSFKNGFYTKYSKVFATIRNIWA